MQNAETVQIRGLGYVLPGGQGNGAAVLQADMPSPTDNAALEGFSAKPYLKSVKGYLDPAGAFTLAAASLAMGEQAEALGRNGGDVGIATMTQYGAAKSAYTFYAQLIQKGTRFASPMMFPHGYANTAGNLAAIEFGFAGPHMVFSSSADVREAVAFAVHSLSHGTATDMLVGAYEACPANTLPDGMGVLHGAVVAWLSVGGGGKSLGALQMHALWSDLPADWSAAGSVHAMLVLLNHVMG